MIARAHLPTLIALLTLAPLALAGEAEEAERAALAAKGIFKLGEEFLYVLRVENDVGSALTPDLRVNWALPPELEFVRGTGTNSATVSGEGQEAGSSMFVLGPNQVQDFRVVCRVVKVPARNLVQMRAAVVTDSGGQELAIETESTTLKR